MSARQTLSLTRLGAASLPLTRLPTPRRDPREEALAEVMRDIRVDATRAPREWLKDAEVPGGGE